ncbi:hypothetical protein, partial [Janthinobacterium sp. RB2R34]|uniref:hypothetical protein n=1 Tax=Janthinobacterium sp. RB2R34 TaxID=3424193 RepID=UPI003F1F8AB6
LRFVAVVMLGLRFDVLQGFGSFAGHRGFFGQQQGLTLFAHLVLLSLCVRGASNLTDIKKRHQGFLRGAVPVSQ